MRDFIPNIDDANTRITQLETELGRQPGSFVDCIDDANERVEELEAQWAKRGAVRSTPAGKTPSSTEHGYTGLRRAVFAKTGFVLPIRGNTENLVRGAGLARAIAAATGQKS